MTISIITICFNSEKTIAKTIESILEQDYQNIEYLIIDGASKDGTMKIVNSYKKKFNQKGIEYVISSEKDKGIYDAMNKGVGKASGDVVGILNSDDYYAAPDVLSHVVKAFKDNDIDFFPPL